MSFTPNGSNATLSHNYVNSNRTTQQPVSSHVISPSNTARESVNGHLQGDRSHLTMNNIKSITDPQKATSPHKLMIGVPPASTPRSNNLNGSANGHHSNNAATQSVQSTGHSTNGKGKEREYHLLDDIPLAQLEQELPLEDADLVPLAALVERLSNYGYEALQNLAETLSFLPSSSKRTKIFGTALDVRKQFIKLLVLSRWSVDVFDLQKARNIIALLSEQQWQHEDVFAGLTDVRKILPNARMRDADLPTAIDVLRTGTYRRLPSSIRNMAVAPAHFTDKEALAIVSRLQDALQTRMLCHEVVPTALSHYSIRDGKVQFKVHGLFEAHLTSSGDGSDASEASTSKASETDRWWLLDLQFDVAASGSAADSANKLFPRKPKPAYRERLRIWGDQELAPRNSSPNVSVSDVEAKASGGKATDDLSMHDQPKVEDGVDGPVEATFSESSELHDRDAPLVRLFAFLQERSLHYQLDILQHQANELCRLNWGSHLRVELREQPRTLILHYWAGRNSDASAKARTSVNAGQTTGGSISLSLVDLEQSHGFEKVMTHLLDGSESNSTPSDVSTARAQARSVRRRGLKIGWNVDSTVVEDATNLELSVSPHSLDLERVLTLIIRRHTTALLRYLQKQILMGENQLARHLRPEDCRLCTDASRRHIQSTSGASDPITSEYLRIDLQGNSHRIKSQNPRTISPLRLSVDQISGRILLEAENNAVPGLVSPFTAITLTARSDQGSLVEASERLNASIASVPEVLHRLEVLARIGEWEHKASFVGLQSTRKLQLRSQEFVKFGPSVAIDGPPVLYIPLGSSFPGYFLALQPSASVSVRIALICVVESVDAAGAASLSLQSIEWLDRVKIATAIPQNVDTLNGSGKRISASSEQPRDTTERSEQYGQGELSMEELSCIHSYSVALVSYYRVEQQLRIRAIPYLHVRSAGRAMTSKRLRPSSMEVVDTSPRAKDDGLAVSYLQKLIPTLCIRATDLVGGDKAHLCKPNVALKVCDWDKAAEMRVEICVRLKMKSRRFMSLKTIFARAASADAQLRDPLIWAEFDADTAVLTFTTKHLDDCIPVFQMYWESIARMTELAREVLNVSRVWQQQAMQQKQKTNKPANVIELRRFSFQDVIFSYGSARTASEGSVQLLARVRWQDANFDLSTSGNMPASPSSGFVVDFGSIPEDAATLSSSFFADSTDASEAGSPAEMWFTGEHVQLNPHKSIAFELRRTINAASHRQSRYTWKGFFHLLSNTLPLVRELGSFVEQSLIDADVPELEVRGATWFRLRFQDRSALDLRLASHSRLLICDASQPLFRSPIKKLAPDDASDAKEVFTGSRQLSKLLDGLPGTDLGTAAPTADAASWLTEQSTHRFQPIPQFERILRDTTALVPTALHKSASSTGVARVLNLRRALLISLAQEQQPSITDNTTNDDAALLLHTLIPALVSQIKAQITPSL